MNTQVPSSIAYTACRTAAMEGVSWTARVLSRAAAKLSHQHISNPTQDLTQTQDFEPIIEVKPIYQTQYITARDSRQKEVDYLGLDSWVLNNEICGFFDCGDEFFSEDEGNNDYGVDQIYYFNKHGIEELSQDEISEAGSDERLFLLDDEDELFPKIPSIILTTPDGEVVIGNAIPEGNKCHFTDEYYALQKQWLDTLENSLVPGKWRQLRDLNRPQGPKINYEEEEALRERHLRIQKKQKRRAEKAACMAHDERYHQRRQERDAAERAWQLQRMEVEDRRYQAQQSQTLEAAAAPGEWVEEMDRQQEEAEKRLQELRDELEERMERDFGVESESEL
ncbi:uncharacterized protein ColSpa_03558 [Colletotrichum spaethianum]|uniref:Uncharacterized protein n=1 Tax=Colletotrichum spaethianum TaxID=700344 RepID=A0AA37LFT3_9PEZI|nr:uncharacterized protein ColSpa_03558 [Colletotrichum spaethianum]GKT43377.1 hypothetical protein ColSpa_03558 [Colletotrichum spaethianum]